MFISKEEKKLSKEFLTNGYIVKKIHNIENLEYIKKFIFDSSLKIINKKIKIEDFFDNFHKNINKRQINNIRLKIIEKINDNQKMRLNYYLLSKFLLDVLVGNELSMQRRLNLSIQLPKDKSSLLQVHADTWSGDSPFEIVVWLPLVNCYKTKSMFILPPKETEKLNKNFKKNAGQSSEKLFRSIKNKVKFLNVNYGEVLIFNQSLPHGNRVNIEKETRWSLNCRFKGAFTPYSDKKIGEFFEPITLKTASILGMNYKEPK